MEESREEGGGDRREERREERGQDERRQDEARREESGEKGEGERRENRMEEEKKRGEERGKEGEIEDEMRREEKGERRRERRGERREKRRGPAALTCCARPGRRLHGTAPQTCPTTDRVVPLVAVRPSVAATSVHSNAPPGRSDCQGSEGRSCDSHGTLSPHKPPDPCRTSGDLEPSLRQRHSHLTAPSNLPLVGVAQLAKVRRRQQIGRLTAEISMKSMTMKSIKSLFPMKHLLRRGRVGWDLDGLVWAAYPAIATAICQRTTGREATAQSAPWKGRDRQRRSTAVAHSLPSDRGGD